MESLGLPPCFRQRHWGTKKSGHGPRATSQEVVELARFSLAAGSVPATRAQLFPHDKLLQHLIRHLRSQYSQGCTSPQDAPTTSTGLGLLCGATSGLSATSEVLGGPSGFHRLGMCGFFFRGSELIYSGQSQDCFWGGGDSGCCSQCSCWAKLIGRPSEATRSAG